MSKPNFDPMVHLVNGAHEEDSRLFLNYDHDEAPPLPLPTTGTRRSKSYSNDNIAGMPIPIRTTGTRRSKSYSNDNISGMLAADDDDRIIRGPKNQQAAPSSNSSRGSQRQHHRRIRSASYSSYDTTATTTHPHHRTGSGAGRQQQQQQQRQRPSARDRPIHRTSVTKPPSPTPAPISIGASTKKDPALLQSLKADARQALRADALPRQGEVFPDDATVPRTNVKSPPTTNEALNATTSRDDNPAESGGARNNDPEGAPVFHVNVCDDVNDAAGAPTNSFQHNLKRAATATVQQHSSAPPANRVAVAGERQQQQQQQQQQQNKPPKSSNRLPQVPGSSSGREKQKLVNRQNHGGVGRQRRVSDSDERNAGRGAGSSDRHDGDGSSGGGRSSPRNDLMIKKQTRRRSEEDDEALARTILQADRLAVSQANNALRRNDEEVVGPRQNRAVTRVEKPASSSGGKAEAAVVAAAADNNDSDEALARRMFEQSMANMMEEIRIGAGEIGAGETGGGGEKKERNPYSKSDSEIRLGGDDIDGSDEALARSLFEQSMANMMEKIQIGGDCGGGGKKEEQQQQQQQPRSKSDSDITADASADDEALARSLFEQSMANMMEEIQIGGGGGGVGGCGRGGGDQRAPLRHRKSESDVPVTDEALALSLFEENVADIMATRKSNHDDAKLARRLVKEETSSRRDVNRCIADKDMEIAKRMQTLEVMGKGDRIDQQAGTNKSDVQGSDRRKGARKGPKISSERRRHEINSSGQHHARARSARDILPSQRAKETGSNSSAIARRRHPEPLAPVDEMIASTKISGPGPGPGPNPGPGPGAVVNATGSSAGNSKAPSSRRRSSATKPVQAPALGSEGRQMQQHPDERRPVRAPSPGVHLTEPFPVKFETAPPPAGGEPHGKKKRGLFSKLKKRGDSLVVTGEEAYKGNTGRRHSTTTADIKSIRSIAHINRDKPESRRSLKAETDVALQKRNKRLGVVEVLPIPPLPVRETPGRLQNSSRRRCTGCHRFEPQGEVFADLGDADRCVCLSCCRTVIVDSSDAKPLWENVLRFFENELGSPAWDEMRDIPILVVSKETIEAQLEDSAAHGGSSQIMAQGGCLGAQHSGRRIAQHTLHFNKESRSFLSRDAKGKGFTFAEVPAASKIDPYSSVTAILCISGLPRDLTACILAHEATHAWFKLHPDSDVLRSLPLQVEEGCCQLISRLYLKSLSRRMPTTSSLPDDDDRLRQYLKFSIEKDESEVYGMGYRMAAKAQAIIGTEALLEHVVSYREFPDI